MRETLRLFRYTLRRLAVIYAATVLEYPARAGWWMFRRATKPRRR